MSSEPSEHEIARVQWCKALEDGTKSDAWGQIVEAVDSYERCAPVGCLPLVAILLALVRRHLCTAPPKRPGTTTVLLRPLHRLVRQIRAKVESLRPSTSDRVGQLWSIRNGWLTPSSAHVQAPAALVYLNAAVCADFPEQDHAVCHTACQSTDCCRRRCAGPNGGPDAAHTAWCAPIALQTVGCFAVVRTRYLRITRACCLSFRAQRSNCCSKARHLCFRSTSESLATQSCHERR